MVKKKEEFQDKAKTTKKNAESKKKDVIKKRKTKKDGNKTNIFLKFHLYFKGVTSEMKKTKWPSKKEMVLYSSATLIFIVIFALFFTLNDVVISLVKQLVR